MEFDDHAAMRFDTSSALSEPLQVQAARYRIEAQLKLPAGANAKEVTVQAAEEENAAIRWKLTGSVSGGVAR
jgi:hypothetical protein